MKITVEIKATPDQADDIAQVLIDYLVYVEGVELISYWVNNDD